MKTNLNITIESPEDAKKFLTELFLNDEHFHPEDDAYDIVNEFGRRVFTDAEAQNLNMLIGQMYNLEGFDPCEVLFRLMCGMMVHGNINAKTYFFPCNDDAWFFRAARIRRPSETEPEMFLTPYKAHGVGNSLYSKF